MGTGARKRSWLREENHGAALEGDEFITQNWQHKGSGIAVGSAVNPGLCIPHLEGEQELKSQHCSCAAPGSTWARMGTNWAGAHLSPNPR